uniref:Protein kinase domain-containing protein n=1 Tax=viral metagenome TaxID=1070528 RepID=A0A6C0DYS9_9ZZZZ
MGDLQIFYKKLLGKGSFSNVYEGLYKTYNIAAKIINTENLDGKIRQQMQREIDVINILKQNKNKNIVEYFDILEKEDELIILMELCNGGELTTEIKIGLDFDTVYNYYCQILNGYSHLLNLDIIHRDIKSANILLSNDKKTVKIGDFGLSKILSDNLNNTICGSPLWMSPELLNQQNYDTKSDIWSIGVLLYEMVYGSTPFSKSNGLKILKHNIFTQDITYLKNSYLNKYIVSDNLINYMKKMLEINQYKRIEWQHLHDITWYDIDDCPEINQDKIKETSHITDTINSILHSQPLDIKQSITEKDIRDDVSLSNSLNYIKKNNYGKSAPTTFSGMFKNVKNIVKNIISL